MPEQFPQVIQVTLISAINVDPHHDEIYWPDRTGFVIDDMDPTFTVKQMDTHIRYKVWLVILDGDRRLINALQQQADINGGDSNVSLWVVP